MTADSFADDAIRLQPLTAADVPLLARWLFDPAVLHWLQLSEDPPELHTLEAVRERFERMAADPWTRTWRIDDREHGPVGQIELVDIHPLQRRAELHLAIGETAVWGRGYGLRAMRLVVRHAFDDLGLRRIYAVADADNARVLRCFEKAGFAREGLLRQHRLRHGVPTDMIIQALLRDD